MIDRGHTPNKAAKITAAVMTSLAHDGPVMPQALASRMDHQYAYALGQGARLALRKQAALLGISRGSVYYEAAPCRMWTLR
jgi:hypothetical protein